jgi:hypothetical protein
MCRRIIIAALIGLCTAPLLSAQPEPPQTPLCYSIPPYPPGYWTLNRRRAAQPFPVPAADGQEDDAGPPHVEQPGTPQMFPLLGDPVPADVSDQPFRSAGKLYFKDAQGKLSWCSAQFAGSARIVLTAAHCVRSWSKGGSWHSDFLFVRADQDAIGQEVVLKSVALWPQYVGNMHNPAYDYAFFFAETRSQGGWMELGTPDSSPLLSSFGYPVNYGAGKQMHYVQGLRGEDGPATISMRLNPMWKGASGGGWIGTWWFWQGGNRVVGLSSYRSNRVKDTMISPRFDEKTVILSLFVEIFCRR